MPPDDSLLIAAKTALSRWGGDPASIRRVAGRTSAVFAVRIAGHPYALRLTNPAFRTRALIEAECDFVAYLASHGIRVAAPKRSSRGNWVEDVGDATGPLFASLNAWVYGEPMESSSLLWAKGFVKSWGRSLADLHILSAHYSPPTENRRWHWRDDNWIGNAAALFDPHDNEIRTAFAHLMADLASLPERTNEFGLIHGDHWPDNFRFDLEMGMTHFDFDNCRYHWFLADVIAPLTILRRLDGGRCGRQCDWLLEGYEERFPISPEIWSKRLQLLQLQRFYVYLSRLALFPEPRSTDQKQTLTHLRELTLHPPAW